MVESATEMTWLHQALAFLVARHGQRGTARLLGVTRPTLAEWIRRSIPTPRMREAIEQAVLEMGEMPEVALAERVEEIAEQVAALANEVAALAARMATVETQQTAVATVVGEPTEGHRVRRWFRGILGAGRS